MPIWMLRMYGEMLPRVRASAQISQASAAAYPHLDKWDARDFMRGLRRMTGQRARKPRPGELEAMGIKVEKE